MKTSPHWRRFTKPEIDLKGHRKIQSYEISRHFIRMERRKFSNTFSIRINLRERDLVAFDMFNWTLAWLTFGYVEITELRLLWQTYIIALLTAPAEIKQLCKGLLLGNLQLKQEMSFISSFIHSRIRGRIERKSLMHIFGIRTYNINL